MIGTTAHMSLNPSGLGMVLDFQIFSLNGEEWLASFSKHFTTREGAPGYRSTAGQDVVML
jgi:hypothetical protein